MTTRTSKSSVDLELLLLITKKEYSELEKKNCKNEYVNSVLKRIIHKK